MKPTIVNWGAAFAATLAACSAAPTQPAQETERAVAPTERQELYVVADFASVCPSAAQALANECGHTVEDDAFGYRRLRGESVTVLGAAPADGVWHAIRFMKSGEQPGFVDASRLSTSAPAPDPGALDTAAAGAVDLVSADLVSLEAGTLGVVRGLTVDQLSVVTERRHGEPMPVSPVTFSLRSPAITVVLPTCLTDERGRPYDAFHGCLENMDCAQLDYRCDADACDTISLLVRKSEDASFEAVMIADRMGVFGCAATD